MDRNETSRKRKKHLPNPIFTRSSSSRSQIHEDDADADDLRILIKDLRTKRVFSPDASALCNLNLEPDLGIPYETQSQKNDDLPEPEVEVSLSGITIREIPPPGIDKCFGAANIHNNVSTTKSVLKPCFRRKLFKTPGSVSYKRLLPYLMDITKDNPFAPENSRCSKLDKGLGQKQQLQPKLASMGQEVFLYTSNMNRCPIDCKTGESGNSPTSVLISANESSNGNVVHSTSAEHYSESLMSFHSKKLVDDKELSVNGHVQKFELDNKSCTKPDTSSVLEDDTKGQSDDRETEKTECLYVCEDQDVDAVNPELSFITDGCHSRRDRGVGLRNDDLKQCETRGMKKANNVCPYKAQNLNPNFSEAENSESFNLKKRGDNGSQVLNQVDNSNEEFVELTPPDAEENGGGRVEFIQKSTDCLGKPLYGTNTRDVLCASDKRNYSHSKSKEVLNPCSRLKLYKSPGSFSYRRLLPFLMDIKKENSCASGNGHQSKLEKGLKVLFAPHVTSDFQGKPIDNSNGCKFHEEHHTTNCGILPMTALTSAHESSNDDESEHSPQDISKFTISLDSQKEHHLQDRYSQLVTSPSKECSVHEIDPQVAALCPPVSQEALSREEGTTLASRRVSVDNEADCPSSFTKSSNAAKPVEGNNLSQITPQLEASAPSGVHGTAHKKGILKRNPRGCRGLCTCLNCASFRLHAERAFEFSRNQMQEAEEVALDLIKELSYLRNMLKKSADGFNDHSVVKVHQVKEACRKASEAEELAKDRIGQMNYELDIHCRITCLQPPRVRFANPVEENVIPKADMPSK